MSPVVDRGRAGVLAGDRIRRTPVRNMFDPAFTHDPEGPVIAPRNGAVQSVRTRHLDVVTYGGLKDGIDDDIRREMVPLG